MLDKIDNWMNTIAAVCIVFGFPVMACVCFALYIENMLVAIGLSVLLTFNWFSGLLSIAKGINLEDNNERNA